MFSSLVIWMLLTSGFCAWIANMKGRNPYFWFVMGLCFTIFALLILLLLPQVKTTSKPKAEEEIKPGETINIQSLSEQKDSIGSALDAVQEWYYLDIQRKTQGPYTLENLQELWHKEQVFADTFVWNEHLKEWTRAKNLQGFIEKMGEEKVDRT